ncbi:MAG TPA: SdpI family protein [Gemmatimonadaceae bacterium]|nr:SdpI family protein [Gemmatimonadaceae bacterium]
MPSVDRKWMPLALIAAAALASVFTYGKLPAMVELRLEGMLPVEPSEPTDLVPRWLALSGIPVLALAIWAAFRAAPTAAGQRVGRLFVRGAPDAVTSPEQFARFEKTYDAIVLAVVALVLGVHAAIIAGALGYAGAAARIVPGVLGGCMILMGNVMPRLRPNWVAGVRTKRTLGDPQLWRSTHRVLGAAFVVSGVLTMVVAFMAPRYGLVTGLAALTLSLIVGMVASSRTRPVVTL